MKISKTKHITRKGVIKRNPRMKKGEINFWKSMKGTELWTNAFGERDCIGIDYPYIQSGGKKIKPTSKQWKKLYNDELIQEYGTTDFKTIMKMEGF